MRRAEAGSTLGLGLGTRPRDSTLGARSLQNQTLSWVLKEKEPMCPSHASVWPHGPSCLDAQPSQQPLPTPVPTVALSCTNEAVVQLKSSGGRQPFSPLQCRTAFPGTERVHSQNLKF